MTTAKKHMCNIADKKLKKLLSKEFVNVNEMMEIFRLDIMMTEESMCGKKKKESELNKIGKIRKKLGI